MTRPLSRRGFVLLIVIAFISMLSLLAVTFAMMSRMERAVSGNYIDQVRAKLLAQSGIERAVMEVRRSIQGTGIPPAQFSIAEDTARPWIYGRPASMAPPRPAFYNPSIPLENAIFASFGVLPNGRARTVRLDSITNQKDPADPLDDTYTNDEFAVSGFSAGTYTQNGDFYAVKVVDAGGMIYINGPDNSDDDPIPANAALISPLAPNVIRMLNSLSQILNRQGRLPFADLGDRISIRRVALARNFAALDEIKPALDANPINQDLYFLAVEPFITAHMWLDPTTLHPQALEHPRANDPNLIWNSQWRAGRSVSTDRDDARRSAGRTIQDGPSKEYSCGSDRLVSDDVGDYAAHWSSASNNAETPSSSPGVTPGAVRQPRAPVNVNTAAVETLEAVLTDLRGQYLNRLVSGSEPRTYMGDGFVSGSGEVIVTQPIALAVARALVTRRNELIMARGYAFATWYDFHAFIDAIDSAAALAALSPNSGATPVNLGGGVVAQAIKDTIKANANPNSRINKFNPDRALACRFGDTDKADLSRWTTEFSFNSSGYFRIESLGRVCAEPLGNGAMPVVAEKRIVTAVKVYEVYRASTQKEFLVNRASGTGTPTAIAYYPEHLMDIAGQGMASWNAVGAEWDGSMMLPTTDINGANAPGNSNFYEHYTNSFGADAAGPAERGVSLVSDGAGGFPAAGGQSELFVDGVFCHETRRYPDYINTSLYGAPGFGASIDDYVRNARADNKLDMQEGTIEMWVKPTWGADDFASDLTSSVANPRAEGTRTFFSCGEGKLGVAYGNTLGPKDQSVCDNRIAFFARKEDGGTYVMGLEATRLAGAWPGPPGWSGPVSPGSYNSRDLYWFWGLYRTNWFRMPQAVEPQYSASMSSWSTTNWQYAGAWHHLRFAWRNDRSWMFVDGVAGGDDPVSAGRAEGQLMRSGWSIFIGSNRFRATDTNGYPCNADCTIDDVRILPRAQTNGNVPPHRYQRTARYEGRIGPRANVSDNAMTTFNYAGRVASVAWTTWMPRYGQMSSTCQLSVRTGGGPYQAAAPTMQAGWPYEQTCRGVGLSGVNVLPGQDCQFRLDLAAQGSNRVGSPIFDDITIVVIPNNPRFLYCSLQ